jgi:hypothetical protein
MTTLLAITLSSFLTAAATPPTTQTQPACATERSDYANAKAAVHTARTTEGSADQVRATYAALASAKDAFMCCLHPDYKSCNH